MNCADVIELLQSPEGVSQEDRREAEAHAATCTPCAQALAALQALDAERGRPIPPPRSDALARAVERSLRAGAEPVPAVRGFWLGAAAGGALAAAATLVIALWLGRSPPPAPAAIPQIALAAGDSRDVSVALTSEEALAGVEIHVVLTGDLALAGYDVRELRWTTDLDRGTNELSLPVVALGAGGGQLTVEVTHGERRRTFVVDVLGRG